MRLKRFIPCILALFILVITACGGADTIQYDKDSLDYACDFMLDVISNGDLTAEAVKDLNQWTQGKWMTELEDQLGIRVETDPLQAAITAWNGVQDECGRFLGRDDYTFKMQEGKLVVAAESQFEKRKAELAFTFDKDMNMCSFTATPHYTMGEILKKAGLNTILGMGTVFLMLIFMSFVIYLLRFTPGIAKNLEEFGKRIRRRKQPEVREEAPEEPEPETEESEEEEPEFDEELVAVIAAAIAAYEGSSTSDFFVRSIRKKPTNQWKA